MGTVVAFLSAGLNLLGSVSCFFLAHQMSVDPSFCPFSLCPPGGSRAQVEADRGNLETPLLIAGGVSLAITASDLALAVHTAMIDRVVPGSSVPRARPTLTLF